MQIHVKGDATSRSTIIELQQKQGAKYFCPQRQTETQSCTKRATSDPNREYRQ